MIAAIALAGVLAAPAPAYGVGAQLTLGQSRLVGPDAADDADGKALGFGLALVGRLNEWIEMRAEVSVDKLEAADLEVWSVAPAILARGYVFARGRTRVYGGAGVARVLRLDASVSDGEDGRNDATDQIRKGDATLIGALGVELARAPARYHAELRWQEGLFTIDPPPGTMARTRVIALGLGVTF